MIARSGVNRWIIARSGESVADLKSKITTSRNLIARLVNKEQVASYIIKVTYR